MCLHQSRDKDREDLTRTLTPKRIVQELDNYIIGQHEAKRAVSIALRNRWRRQQLSEELREEVLPKNIILIGPTGVGKTEIARRLAGLVDAPFLKVEASKYTEVGYHGRDVESMVRDLVDLSVSMVRADMLREVRADAERRAEARLLECLYEPPGSRLDNPEKLQQVERTRERISDLLNAGKLEDREVEIEVTEKPVLIQGMVGSSQDMGIDMEGLIEKMIPGRVEKRRMTVAEARQVLVQEEAERMLDKEAVYRKAIWKAENAGIIFVDELDKIAGAESKTGPDVSRQGVQRDLLPIVEGSTVPTRYGMVRTDHILFIGAGAFNVAKPSDLIPELQGRFPIREELKELTKDDFVRILNEPKNALTKQYKALLEAEGVELDFSEDALVRIAEIAEEVNQRTQSIGARRLQTVMEKLLEEVSFNASEMGGQRVRITAEFVDDKLKELVKDEDLTRFIL